MPETPDTSGGEGNPLPPSSNAPPATAAPGGSGGLLAVGLALVVVGQAAMFYGVREFFTDDAWISLRYALRFAHGDGAVWNAGGPLVEGYSNPLLVFSEALVMRLGLDAWAFARAQGVVAAVATVGVVGVLGQRILGRGGALVAAALVGLYPAFAYWSIGGLETAAYTLGVTTGVLLLARGGGAHGEGAPVPVRGEAVAAAGLVFAILPWLRPEALGLILPVVAVSEVGACFEAVRGRGDRRRALHRLLWLLGPVLLSTVALEGVRYGLYGHLLPNSVLYKSGNGKLGSVTSRFVLQAWPVLLVALPGIFTLRGRARLVAVPALVAFVGSPFFLNSVNDFSRLLLPTWPAWSVLAAAGMSGIAARLSGGVPFRGAAILVAFAGTVLALVILVTPASVYDTTGLAHLYATCKAGTRRVAADWIRENVPPEQVYAIADAGLVPYRADGKGLDIFGLNEASLQKEPHLAAAQRAKQVLKLKPEWLVITSRELGGLVPHYKVERELVARKEFATYQLAHEVDGHACEFNLRIYRREAPAQ